MCYISFLMLTANQVNAQNGFADINREADIYTIYNMEVDETSRNVATARDRALRKGQRGSLMRLFRRMILTTDMDRLPEFSDLDVQDYVNGFEINNERRSSVRYIASLVVHFNRDKINDVLSNNQIPYAETLGRAVSVLPVFEEGGTLRLWEKDNLWREAWQNYDMTNNLVPVDTPAPTLKNRFYISALQAKNDDQRSIASFIEKSALNELIIAVANLRKSASGDKISLDIHLKQNSLVEEAYYEPKTLSVTLPAYDETGKSNLEALYMAGVDAASGWVDDLWKMQVLVNYGISSKIAVRGDLEKINDWVIMQRQLEKVNLVKKVDLKSLNIETVDLEIEFSGEAEQLVLSLAQQGVRLSQNEETENWEIGLTNVATSGRFN
jgi:hypothetical protein